jgi:hypothetical protein
MPYSRHDLEHAVQLPHTGYLRILYVDDRTGETHVLTMTTTNPNKRPLGEVRLAIEGMLAGLGHTMLSAQSVRQQASPIPIGKPAPAPPKLSVIKGGR